MRARCCRFNKSKMLAFWFMLCLQTLQCKSRSYQSALSEAISRAAADSCDAVAQKFGAIRADGLESFASRNGAQDWEAYYILSRGLVTTTDGAVPIIAKGEAIEFGFEVEFYPHLDYNPNIVCFYAPAEPKLNSEWPLLSKQERLQAALDFIDKIKNSPEFFKKMSFKLLDPKDAPILPQILTQESTGKIEADLGSGPLLKPFAAKLKLFEDLFGPYQVQGHLTLPLNETWQKVVPLGYRDFVLAESDAALIKILAKEYEIYSLGLLQKGPGQRVRLPAGHFLSQTLRPVNENMLTALSRITKGNDQGVLLKRLPPDLFLLKFFAAPVLRDANTYKSSFQGRDRFGFEFRQFDFPSVGEPALPGFYFDLLNALARAASQLGKSGRFKANYTTEDIPPVTNSTLNDFSSKALEIITDPHLEGHVKLGLDEDSEIFRQALRDLTYATSSEGLVALRNFRNLLQISWLEAQGSDSSSRLSYEVSQAVLFPFRAWYKLPFKEDAAKFERRLWPAALNYLNWVVAAAKGSSRSPESIRENLSQLRIELAKWAYDSNFAELF